MKETVMEQATQTVMATKLAEAGVALPLNKRVWLWVKDHPKSSATDLAAALKETVDKVGGALRDLESRRMLERTEESRRIKGKANTYVDRYIVVYSVPPRLAREEFELLPKPVPKKKAEAPAPAPAPTPAPAPQAPPPVQVSSAAPKDLQHKQEMASFIETLTLRELRELYQMLHGFFGKEK